MWMQGTHYYERSNSTSSSRRLLKEIRESNIILKLLKRRHGIWSSVAESNISTLVNNLINHGTFLYLNNIKKLLFVKLWVDPVPTMCRYLVVYENLEFVAYDESGRILSKTWRTMCTIFHKIIRYSDFHNHSAALVIKKCAFILIKMKWKYNHDLKWAYIRAQYWQR